MNFTAVICLLLCILFTHIVLSMEKTYRLYNRIRPITYYKNVPKIIHRTSKDIKVSQEMYDACHKKWAEMNPNYTIIWYDNIMCDKFMQQNYPGKIYDTYKKLKPGAYKADLWRLCILYKYGGVYIDAFATPHVTIDKMLVGCYNNLGPQFISILDTLSPGNGIHNGFIVAEQGHPFLKQGIEDIVHNTFNNFYGKSPLDVTGPLQLSRSISKITKSKIPHKIGRNKYGYFSYYLFTFGFGPHQNVYKQETKILSKYYSYLFYLTHKITNKNGYTKLWYKRDIYN